MYSFPQDKVNHYFYGSLAASFGAVVAIYLTQNAALGAAGGLLAFVVGGLKEYSDYRINKRAGTAVHGVEWQDAVATGLPSVPIGIPLLLLHFMK